LTAADLDRIVNGIVIDGSNVDVSGTRLWMDTAQGEIGEKEIPGPAADPRIIEYHATTTLAAQSDEIAWCSSFANWNMDQNDIWGTDNARALSWRNYGQSAGTDPSYGAIGIIDHGGGYAHVGFVAGVTPNGNVVLLGGNQSDQVMLSAYPAAGMTFRLPLGYQPVPAPVLTGVGYGGSMR
jgi:uncharacterized protein (TIGR02594 family)